MCTPKFVAGDACSQPALSTTDLPTIWFVVGEALVLERAWIFVGRRIVTFEFRIFAYISCQHMGIREHSRLKKQTLASALFLQNFVSTHECSAYDSSRESHERGSTRADTKSVTGKRWRLTRRNRW